jgi:hypothetical protein
MQTQDPAPDPGPDGDEPEIELISPEDFLPRSPFPPDAQRMGFDRFTGSEGAILAMASALDGRKPSHRLFALVLLILVAGSFLLTVWGQLH